MDEGDESRPALKRPIWEYGGPWTRQRPGPPPGREDAGRVTRRAAANQTAPQAPSRPPVVEAVRAAGGSAERGALRTEIAEHYNGDDLDEALARATASGDLIYVPAAMGYLLPGATVGEADEHGRA